MNTAGLGIRARLAVWLVVVTFPILLSSAATVFVIEARLSERIETDLMNVRRLEGARITDVLSSYRREADSLASDADVRRSLEALENEAPPAAPGFAPSTGTPPLAALAESLTRSAGLLGSEIVGVDIVDREGRSLGRSVGHSWTPRDPTLATRAMDTATTLFGEAFRTAAGAPRLGMAAPVRTANGRTLGALLLETRLAPVVDPVLEHEGFGQTSEAHIAQPTTSGDAQFITLLRFARDAAFDKVVPASKGLPINQALHSPGGRLVNAKDYRGIESILAIETLPDTGWGLVVKIDRAESFAPVAEVKRVVLAAGIASAALVLLGWVMFLHPLGRRLAGVARAAERVAAGDLRTMLADPTGDEIGHIARSIDKLAADLVVDRRERGLAEQKLVAQATRDELTGLMNRQRGGAIIDELDRTSPSVPASVLFLDLDGFKAVNDCAGHAAGDEILVAVARRLEGVLDERAVPVRWGGDEFVVVLPGADAGDAARVCARVQAIFDEPVRTSFGRYAIGCSVGVGTSGEGRALAEVLHAADASMYAQKRRRRQSRGVGGSGRPATERPDVLALALDERRLEAWYQPIVRLSSDGETRLVGAEALARIRNVDGSVTAPAAFAGELSGAIGQRLDIEMMRLGTAALRRWLREARVGADFVLSLNMSAESMRTDDFADALLERIDRLELPAARLCVEVTEDIVELNADVLGRLRDAGVHIALRGVAPVLLQGYRFAAAQAGGTFITAWGLDPAEERGVALPRVA